KLGYTADTVANRLEALQAAIERSDDLLLMDIQVPEMHGLESTRCIREQATNQPIIIAMTANALQGDRAECLSAGMNDYINKPVKLDELVAMLQRCAVQIKKTS